MSLFGSIRMASNSLAANQLGIQVVGNNISNANTPGYVREEINFVPATTQKIGTLNVGMGVRVDSITQKIDRFLEERLRGASSDLAQGETQEEIYLQLESVIGELSDTDLSTSMTKFFNSINDVLNQPESISVRNLAVLLGDTLTTDFNRLSSRVQSIRDDVNDQIIDSAGTINRLLDKVATLNVQIVSAEGGKTSSSDAGGLRDERSIALAELSELVGIKSVEQESGAVTVFLGGEYLVFDGIHREVKAVVDTENGYGAAEIRLVDGDSEISLDSGKLAGLKDARDNILTSFLGQLDDLAATLISEFNQIHSSGQGLSGYTQVLSEFDVESESTALDQLGLPFTPVNGSFQVQVLNTQTGLTETTDILVPLNGDDDDVTLNGLAAALDAVDGLSASVTPQRKLEIKADSPVVEFAFADDTSGVLAALGIGTFFSGSTAGDISVNAAVRTDPGKFAASQGGIGADTENGLELAGFFDRSLESKNGDSLAILYDRLTGDTTQAAAVSRAVAEGFRVFQQTLEGQHLAISGVNLDEETVRLIQFQRAYQANAKFISTAADLLETLINL